MSLRRNAMYVWLISSGFHSAKITFYTILAKLMSFSGLGINFMSAKNVLCALYGNSRAERETNITSDDVDLIYVLDDAKFIYRANVFADRFEVCGDWTGPRLWHETWRLARKFMRRLFIVAGKQTRQEEMCDGIENSFCAKMKKAFFLHWKHERRKAKARALPTRENRWKEFSSCLLRRKTFPARQWPRQVPFDMLLGWCCVTVRNDETTESLFGLLGRISVDNVIGKVFCATLWRLSWEAFSLGQVLVSNFR